MKYLMLINSAMFSLGLFAANSDSCPAGQKLHLGYCIPDVAAESAPVGQAPQGDGIAQLAAAIRDLGQSPNSQSVASVSNPGNLLLSTPQFVRDYGQAMTFMLILASKRVKALESVSPSLHLAFGLGFLPVNYLWVASGMAYANLFGYMNEFNAGPKQLFTKAALALANAAGQGFYTASQTAVGAAKAAVGGAVQALAQRLPGADGQDGFAREAGHVPGLTPAMDSTGFQRLHDALPSCDASMSMLGTSSSGAVAP